MAAPIWIGSTDVKESPGSPRYSFNAARNEVTRSFSGPFNSVYAQRPLVGQTMSGVGSEFVVERVEVSKNAGGIGQMTITLAEESPEVPNNTVQEPTYEIEWVQLEKKLGAHRRFLSGGDNALTSALWSKISAWEAATTAADKDTAYTALSGGATTYADLIRAGVESFLVFSPVARKTSYTYQVPTTSFTGLIQTPTGFPNLPTKTPNNYVWLKTADRSIRTGRNGKWERVEEWTGADAWSTFLYTTAP